MQKLTTEEFIERAIIVHKDKYDYSKVTYIDSSVPVTIICPIHGEFSQRAGSHLRGHGCMECKHEKQKIQLRRTSEEFIQAAQAKHGNKYDYSKVKYMGSKTKVTIKCNTCGHEFKQAPDVHLEGKGCPNCVSSRGEVCIAKYLTEHNIEFTAQYSVKIETEDATHSVRYDFYIPKHNLLLEFQGKQHYEFSDFFHRTQENYLYRQQMDVMKMDWAIRNGYNFIPIPYWDLDRIDKVLDELFMEDVNEDNDHN